MSDIVEHWFGTAFQQLHPLLQRLHRTGGVLSGPVQIRFGSGLAGMLGRRIAHRTGVPTSGADHHLRVAIHARDGVLHWERSFDGQSSFSSLFLPVGHYPTGHWLEQTGPVALRLGVDIVDGGWHWQHRDSRIRGLPLPAWCLPRLIASKCVEGSGYRFAVCMSLPLLGFAFAYAGTLALSLDEAA
ncbi:DUF4166 domain-containing protein [Massilia sp. CF038]|uniref:DUF4166 domain-containing protein n=1 Tax=Massilia sp. CF038 TaxID=1881045 RepID=UPI0009134E55|nr:DUF4166 domain-containing protein [Massilia sp. CF038]SHH70010.1 protein of unknown function [Massilia sp. CF038]